MKTFNVTIEAPDEYTEADLRASMNRIKWVDGVRVTGVSELKLAGINLEAYLRKNLDNIIIDHSLRAEIVDDQVTFYIHPAHVSGDTLDFVVKGNNLEPRNLIATTD